jgi:hypothetical protein
MSKPIAGILQTKEFIIIEDTKHDTRKNRNDEELPEDLGDYHKQFLTLRAWHGNL